MNCRHMAVGWTIQTMATYGLQMSDLIFGLTHPTAIGLTRTPVGLGYPIILGDGRLSTMADGPTTNIMAGFGFPETFGGLRGYRGDKATPITVGHPWGPKWASMSRPHLSKAILALPTTMCSSRADISMTPTSEIITKPESEMKGCFGIPR